MDNKNAIITDLMAEFQSDEWAGKEKSLSEIFSGDIECSDSELDGLCRELELRKETENAPSGRYFPSC